MQIDYGQRKRLPALLLRSSKDFREISTKSILESLTKTKLHLCYFDHSFIILAGIRNGAEKKESKYTEHICHPF